VVERLETDGIVANRELRWRRKDGGVAWIQLDAVAVRDEEGKVRYFQAFVRDITERKALQEQLVQAQKMEAVGRLAGGIAHDFNNLLTAIKGNADLALMDLPAATPLRSDLEEIQAAAERAARLTRQLLMFSRKQVAEVEPLDLNQLLQDLEKMLRRILGEDVDLHLRTASDIGLVEADRGQMEQVVMNLVINARDAMPKGGKLTIETTQVELDADYARLHAEVTPGPHVVLSVSDTGQGMDAETQRHIFEPFFTTKPEGRGTGLGLATVYGVVKQCRGHIWVYSEPERGTVFKIYLPVSAALAREPARPSLGAAVPGGTETIVLVEDETGVRDLAVRVLERFGYSVITTHSPLEALEVFQTRGGPLDLILTDVVMPKMSGPELIEQVRSIRPDIKVLFMSGYTDETVMRHGILAAGVPFLQKPFSSTQLATKVREVLDG
jgi:signal transduction histidine kinase